MTSLANQQRPRHCCRRCRRKAAEASVATAEAALALARKKQLQRIRATRAQAYRSQVTPEYRAYEATAKQSMLLAARTIKENQ